MNCRQIERILPELASGEVDERTAALAQTHMASCPACASEFAEYQTAMSALAQPHESFECPPELNQLYLPEPSRTWSWARPVFVTAAIAAVLAGVIIMPRQPVPVSAPQVAVNPPKHTTVTLKNRPLPTKLNIAESAKKDSKQPHRRVRHTVVASAKIGAGVRPEVSESLSLKHSEVSISTASLSKEAWGAKSRVPASAPSPDPALETWAFDSSRGMGDKTEGSVIVLACDIEPEPVSVGLYSEPVEPIILHIESTDESTGSTVLYDYSLDSEGREQIIESTSRRPLGS